MSNKIKILACLLPIVSIASCSPKSDEEKTTLFVNKLMQEQHISVAKTKSNKQENNQNITEIDKSQSSNSISIAPQSSIKTEPLSAPPSNLTKAK